MLTLPDFTISYTTIVYISSYEVTVIFAFGEIILNLTMRACDQ